MVFIMKSLNYFKQVKLTLQINFVRLFISMHTIILAELQIHLYTLAKVKKFWCLRKFLIFHFSQTVLKEVFSPLPIKSKRISLYKYLKLFHFIG